MKQTHCLFSLVICLAFATVNLLAEDTPPDNPDRIAEGAEWVALDFNSMTAPDSILDFSKFTDKPAGKFGPVVIDENGHFTFRDAPGKRIRFFGPNLCANYLSPELQDRFVEQVSRLGYNIVRFHHYERGLQSWDNLSSLDVKPDRMDMLDSLFAKLKAAGIYITIDLYASRQFEPKDGIKERETGSHNDQRFEMKPLCPVSETAMENWKGFARMLLTHVNPYTGIAWGQDPALAIVNLINEDNLIYNWAGCEEYKPIYEAKYAEYLAEIGMDTPENRAARGGLFVEFLNKVQTDCIREQMRFLTEELHVQAQMTDLNFTQFFTTIEPRGILPLVDNHVYWDHPSFPEKPWDFPYRYSNLSSIWCSAASPRWLMPTRIFGKPFISTEFHFCYPNRKRMEGGVVMGAYAGLQDWDGLNRFAWSHYLDTMAGDNPGCVPKHFDINNDPLAQLDERILWLLFVRGDVSPATTQKVAFTATRDDVRALPDMSGNFPDAFSELGLYTAIGSLPQESFIDGVTRVAPLSDTAWKDSLDPQAAAALEEFHSSGKIASSTGEIMLDVKGGAITVVTPRSEAGVFPAAMDGDVLHVAQSTRFCTVGLFAMDGEDLRHSSKLLLLHIPNVLATDIAFADKWQCLVTDWGHTPILVERAAANVSINLPGEWTVTALKLDGTPLGPVSTANDGNAVSFTLKTDAFPGGVMAYSLTRD